MLGLFNEVPDKTAALLAETSSDLVWSAPLKDLVLEPKYKKGTIGSIVIVCFFSSKMIRC